MYNGWDATSICSGYDFNVVRKEDYDYYTGVQGFIFSQKLLMYGII